MWLKKSGSNAASSARRLKLAKRRELDVDIATAIVDIGLWIFADAEH
jgi:hypothetical protein